MVAPCTLGKSAFRQIWRGVDEADYDVNPRNPLSTSSIRIKVKLDCPLVNFKVTVNEVQLIQSVLDEVIHHQIIMKIYLVLI